MKKLWDNFTQWMNNRDSGIFRRIPLHTSGALFTSPMPYGAYDPGNRLLKIFKKQRIGHVIMLVTDMELKKKARRDLFKTYEKAGISWSRFIINDFQAPSLEVIQGLVHEALKRLNRGERVLVHCHAGVGRTSVSVSCITIALENISADEAIAHVKSNMMVNITSEQIRLIKQFSQTARSASL